MQGRGFPWFKLLMVLLMFAASFIAHDIRTHGSFAGPFQSRPRFFVPLFEVLTLRTCVCVSESTTASHLHRSGVMAVSQQAWSKIAVYTKQGFRYDSSALHSRGSQLNTAQPPLCCSFFRLCSWLEKNTPHYYSECVRVVGPLIEQGCEKTKTAVIFLSEKAVQIILWVQEKTPQAIEWVTPWNP